MRTFEEIADDVGSAMNINDSEAMLRLATELVDVGTPNAIAMANGVKGWVTYLHGDYAESLEHYHRALSIYEEQADGLGAARMIGSIGNIHDKIGDHALALEFYHRAMAAHESFNDRYGVARAHTNIGIVYYNTANYPAAIDHYHRAHDIYEELNDNSGVAVATSNIGTALIRAGEHQTALTYFQRSMEIHEAVGHLTSTASDVLNIGQAYAFIGDHTAAIDCYHRALTLFHDLGIKRGIAAARGNMVKVCLDVNSVTEAQAHFDALDAMQIDDPDLRAAREYHRASLQEFSGDLDGAVATLQRALSDAIDHGLRSEIADIHKALRDLALKQNDLSNYVKHNNELTRITDEISGKDTATKLAMQTKQREIDAERKETEKQLAVLHATLPKHIADRVSRGEVVNDHYEHAALLFLDIVGFTSNTSHMPPADVVKMLENIFSTIDGVCNDHGVIKIKTIGDSYMCFRGDADARSNALSIMHVALEVMKGAFTWPNGSPIQFRAGIHIGPATAGVIGTQRLQYDVWGDTVNVASRLESTSEPGRIHVSEAVANALNTSPPSPLSSLRGGTNIDQDKGSAVIPHDSEEPGTWHLALRGETELKGKGTMTTYWLEAKGQ